MQSLRALPWAVRLALFGLLALAGLLIWTTNSVLSQRFAESARARSEVRLTLFSGNLVAELERQEIVPLLLARDAALVGALASGDFTQTSQHLIRYSDEIGAAELRLLDVSGRVVATTRRETLGANRRPEPYFIDALRSNTTVFTATPDDAGRHGFFYSRRIDHQGELVGVIVVEVGLSRFPPRWRGLSEDVVLLDTTGRVLLSTDGRWLGELEEAFLEPLSGRMSPRARSIWPFRAPADGQIEDITVMRQELRVPFRGWRLVDFTPYAEVRERVNAVLAVEVMGFAILLALLFFALSRQSERRSRRLVLESDRLRRLNTRLQAEIAERERAERSLQVAEQSLAQSSKLAALGEMSAAVSHELNQPLAAMKTYLAGARLLIRRNRGEEALASFHRINGLIDRMAAITRQLKAHARKEADELRPVDLRDCVASALDIMSPQVSRSAARIRRTLPDTPVMVMADPVRIEQVLVNLVRNAIEASAGSDEPTIDIVLSTGEVATLSVRDNGTGIEDLGALFEPFYTTKPPGEGVGLGLAISSSIIQSLDGRLTARNGSQGGAIFKLDLPLIALDEIPGHDKDLTKDAAAE